MTFEGAELNYPVHEKELLAIIRALKKWKVDLLGSPFFIYTDQIIKHYKTLTHRRTCRVDKHSGWNSCRNMTPKSFTSKGVITRWQMLSHVFPVRQPQKSLKTWHITLIATATTTTYRGRSPASGPQKLWDLVNPQKLSPTVKSSVQ